MITLLVNDKPHELPLYVSIDQWSKLLKWDIQEPSHWPRMMSYLTNVDEAILRDADPQSLSLGASFIASILQRRQEVSYETFDKLVFGQWVDLDVYISMGVDKSLQDITNIIAPKSENAAQALYVVDKFMEYRTYIYKQYSELFGLNDLQDDDPIEDDGSKAQSDHMEIARNWYKIIVGLADNNILNIDDITAQPLLKVFNFMALRKQQALDEMAQQKKQQRQYDLQRNR